MTFPRSIAVLFLVWATACGMAVEPRTCGFATTEETLDSSQALGSDLILELTGAAGSRSQKQIVKIKGEQMRCDMPDSPNGPVSLIWNTKNGEYQVLMHLPKSILRTSMDIQNKQMQEKQEENRIDPKQIEKPAATGKIERVGRWEAEIFESVMGKNKVRLWVVKGFPNYRALQARMDQYLAIKGGLLVKSFDLGGLVVKAESTTQRDGMTRTTLLGFREGRVDDSEFEAPAGYTDFGELEE